MNDDKLRFYDEECFGEIVPAPNWTDDFLRRRIARLPTKALRREARAAMDSGDRDRAKYLLMHHKLI